MQICMCKCILCTYTPHSHFTKLVPFSIINKTSWRQKGKKRNLPEKHLSLSPARKFYPSYATVVKPHLWFLVSMDTHHRWKACSCGTPVSHKNHVCATATTEYCRFVVCVQSFGLPPPLSYRSYPSCRKRGNEERVLFLGSWEFSYEWPKNIFLSFFSTSFL